MGEAKITKKFLLYRQLALYARRRLGNLRKFHFDFCLLINCVQTKSGEPDCVFPLAKSFEHQSPTFWCLNRWIKLSLNF